MKNKKGFTLTELMVVVIAIGILASVAIPEYMSAVDKSRWGSLVTPTRSIKEAQEAKYMSTGRYASNVLALSVDIVGKKKENVIKVDKRTFTLDSSNEEGASNFTVVAEDASLPNVRLVMYQTFSPNFADDLHCEALMENTRANRLCQDVLEGTLIGKRAQYYSYLIEGNGAGKLMNWPQKMDKCSTSKNSTCYGVQNEDGSWEEHFTSSGIEYTRYYDEEGKKYKQVYVTEEGKQVTATYDENGNRTWQESVATDGTKSEYTFDALGNKTSYEYYDANGNLAQKAEYQPGTNLYSGYEFYYDSGELQKKNTYDENGIRTHADVYLENGNLRAVYDYENGVISSREYFWSATPGTTQYIDSFDSAGNAVRQDRYWEDGSVRGVGMYTGENTFIDVNYNKDGTIAKSYDYAQSNDINASRDHATATVSYTYKPDGTYTTSTGLSGTYSTNSEGNIVRSDGVILLGSGNFSNLCAAHPTSISCKN